MMKNCGDIDSSSLANCLKPHGGTAVIKLDIEGLAYAVVFLLMLAIGFWLVSEVAEAGSWFAWLG